MWPLGGMADAGDLKSFDRKIVPVQVRQGPPKPEKAVVGALEAADGAHQNLPSGQAIGQDPGQPPESPRRALIAALANAVREAAAAGDLAAARVAHEALGRLLTEACPRAVVDLSAERERRR